MRLLFIEDDDQIGEGVQTGLSLAGHAVDWVTDARTARAALRAQGYDMLVLDIGLPDACGFALLKEIRRSFGNPPILILSARDSLDARVQGLNGGADDYLVKPFALDELEARLRAIERRRSDTGEPELRHRGIYVDVASHRVTHHGKPVRMSRREFALLRLLLSRRGKALSKSLIEQQIYAWGEEVESNAVEVHIHHLRRKFGTDLIRTVRGVGYLIEDES